MDEWLRLIESVDNYRDKLIVKLLYSTGMRVGELTKLKVENIDFRERFIHIPADTKIKEEEVKIWNKIKIKKGKGSFQTDYIPLFFVPARNT